MKKFLFIFILFFTSSIFSQLNQDTTVTWIPFFEDSIKTQPFLSENPYKYIFSMSYVLQNIEKRGQDYLDELGRVKMWFVPKSLSDQVEAICIKHNLVVKWKREGY
jgi:hypothetical protein